MQRLLASALVLLALAAGLPQASAQATLVQVAILDSGIDSAHAEFEGRTIDRHSFAPPALPRPPPLPGVPAPPNPFDDVRPDTDGQGTGVASRVAGKSLGAASKDAGLVDLQVVGNYTGGQLDARTEQAAADAMDWLQANGGGNGSAGPRIAVLSFASRGLSGQGAQNVVAAAQRLWDQGVLVIVPMGDTALHRSPYVLTVGMELPDCTTTFARSAVIKPDVAGLGANVEVAVPRQNPTETAPQATASKSGPAYAAAHAASVAAAIWSKHSDLPIEALAAILRDTATDVGPEGPDSCTGHGLVDAQAALAAAEAWTDPTPTTPLARPSPAPLLAAAAALALTAAWRRRRA